MASGRRSSRLFQLQIVKSRTGGSDVKHVENHSNQLQAASDIVKRIAELKHTGKERWNFSVNITENQKRKKGKMKRMKIVAMDRGACQAKFHRVTKSGT